jgi:CubicO group peptidase (beta-lactamase class C family)
MKKKVKISIVIICLIVVGTLGYVSIPFTTSKGNDFHKKLSKSDNYNEQANKIIGARMEKNEADALFIMEGQKILGSFGETGEVSNVASVRKSLISALFGIAESKGLINIKSTLGDLNVNDEKNPLTEVEKKATVEDLLKARSGIYINSIGESERMKEKRPKRGSYKNNEYYYYNNWDFNALGVIFEKETGMTLGYAFYEWIAKPTEMRKFRPENVVYQKSEETSIPMYRFYMCAEDLARFGSLYANDGQWENNQIIPKQWVDASFIAYSEIGDVDKFTGYGYLWWLDHNMPQKLQWAVGSGGQFIVIDRENKITIAMMNNTGTSPLGVYLYKKFGSGEESYSEAREIYKIISSN